MMRRMLCLGVLLLSACATDSPRGDGRGPSNLADAATSPAVQNIARVDYDLLWEAAQEVLRPYQVREEDKDAGTITTRTFFWKGETVPRYCFIEMKFKETDATYRNWKYGVWAYRVERKFDGEPFKGGDMGQLEIVGTYEELQKEIAQEVLTRYLTRTQRR